MKRVVITGGAGFVGGNLAVKLKESFEDLEVVTLDNLHREGSQYHLERLEKAGVKIIRGDVRSMEDLVSLGSFDFLIECSAEPSVLAGTNSSVDYLIRTNLHGATNCLEICRQRQAGIIFLSSSRVYPYGPLQELKYSSTGTRFELLPGQHFPGVTAAGISETFPMEGARSLYGASKYAAEIILGDYRETFDLPVIINRCGVIAGPWQFGRVDQGIVTYWLASHINNRALKYIGFDCSGSQVRDILHVEDLFQLIKMQLQQPALFQEGVFNIGGGRDFSISLCELTDLCQAITGVSVPIGKDPNPRYADIPIYISDNTKINSVCGWEPAKSVKTTVEETFEWIQNTPRIKQLF